MNRAQKYPKTNTVIGVMSGTSVDGLDIVACEFMQTGKKWIYKVIDAESYPYDEAWHNRLISVIRMESRELHILDVDYGKYIGNTIMDFMSKRNLKIDLISSHGHTVFHQPEYGLTLQIGDGLMIHATTGIPVVSDFRRLDVLAGGQGAPLVPVGDAILFNEFDACLNLGGFSNISFQRLGLRIAFDICPVNIVLNFLARREGRWFDEGGNQAKRGNFIKSLFDDLNNLDFYKKSYPKSLGLEWVEKNIWPLLDVPQSDTNDLLNTFVRHISCQINRIVEAYRCPENQNQPISVLVTGGGAYNDFLLQNMQTEAGDRIIYIIPEKRIVDFKEAITLLFLDYYEPVVK